MKRCLPKDFWLDRSLFSYFCLYLQDGAERHVDPISLIDAVMPEASILSKYKRTSDIKPNNAFTVHNNNVVKPSPSTPSSKMSSPSHSLSVNNISSPETSSSASTSAPVTAGLRIPKTEACLTNGGPDVVIIGESYGTLYMFLIFIT